MRKFDVKVTVFREDEDGKVKGEKAVIIVEGENFSDVESKVLALDEEMVIEGIVLSKVVNIIGYDKETEDESYFFAFENKDLVLDESTGKTKKRTISALVQAEEFDEAKIGFITFIEDYFDASVNITKTQKTKVTKIIFAKDVETETEEEN